MTKRTEKSTDPIPTLTILIEITELICAEAGTFTDHQVTRIKLEKERPMIPKSSILWCVKRFQRDGYIECMKNNIVIIPNINKPGDYDVFRLTSKGKQLKGQSPYNENNFNQ